MNMKEILRAMKELSYSQGFYGRLLNNLLELEENDPYSYERVVEELEGQNFGDTIDMVMYFEC